MTRKDFFAKVGFGAAVVLVPTCIGGLASSCSGEDEGSPTPAPTNVDFTLDISTGTLAVNGGFLVHSGIVVARTNTGEFLAVSASCTHQGTNVNYNASGNKFICPNHGAQFNSTGVVTQGPASSNLTQYNTQLTDATHLRVFS
ncbi:QcrA and Rieske domain-containing protein [Flavobacterium phycosphaerae]|uniref:QcrA and Rieske domain-containing protein n=1 Tax=Flavobacterium phycosphaerae TaxID=2697515 RepID=UPI00138AF652|nr:Rieske (2Fe-2S) protein [Flavobacterium phycosphaerae]